MGGYTKSDIKYIIRENDFERLFRNCNNRRDRAWITVLWLTGCRPTEARQLNKEHIKIEEDKTSFLLSTLKIAFKKKDGFIIEKRNLVLNISKDHRYIKNLQIYINHFKPEQRIFDFVDRTGEYIISRLSKRALNIELCPYNFRHSRMTLLAEKGATKETLKKFKGARSDRSINEYLHARAVEYDVEVEF